MGTRFSAVRQLLKSIPKHRLLQHRMLALPARHMAIHQRSEGLGVVLFKRVAKLVNNEVVLYRPGKLHHLWVKLQYVMLIATGPATLDRRIRMPLALNPVLRSQ